MRQKACALQALERLGAFQPGQWNIIDGWLFEKTLNLSGNSLSGPLPAWALQRQAADGGLTVKLQVGAPALCTSLRSAPPLSSMQCISMFACMRAPSVGAASYPARHACRL